jgi:hypothetical protein
MLSCEGLREAIREIVSIQLKANPRYILLISEDNVALGRSANLDLVRGDSLPVELEARLLTSSYIFSDNLEIDVRASWYLWQHRFLSANAGRKSGRFREIKLGGDGLPVCRQF